MTRWRLIVALVLSSCVAVVIDHGGAQIFPSNDLTKAFEGHLEEVARNNGWAFVSSCWGPDKSERAVLLIPIGADTGTVTFIQAQRVYNGAGIKIENNGIVIVEGGGGEWSLRKLQFFADKLGAAHFELESGARLRGILRARPSNRCPSFE